MYTQMANAVQLGSALSGCLNPDTEIRKSSENVIEHVGGAMD